VIVVVIWSAEHARYPLLISGGGLDLEFAAYRVVSVLPFLATWTALYLHSGGDCFRSRRPIFVSDRVGLTGD
jgi:hypothetical protein